ncbi:restriction endonuclease subunit S [Paenibacillus illinoisensis]|uniref:restriction endonuclease subunit S n=1 Tax=Paenibacillus illinoisensis TaxID=59845 RepID=UPI003D2DD402
MSKKKTKSLEELLTETVVPVEEQPYEVPKNWVWVKTGHCIDIERGITFPASAKNYTFQPGLIGCARTSNIQEEFIWDDMIYIDSEYYKGKLNKLVKENDILMSSANSYHLVGKVSYIHELKEKITFGGFLLCIRTDKVNPKFLYYFFKNQFNSGVFKKMSNQTTNIANINSAKIESLPFPVPPNNEQIRIVEKVDRLLEKINGAKQLIDEAKATFELRRSAILNKAFRGELTKKWRTDNQDKLINGTELYELIKSDRFENVESNRELKELVQLFESFSLKESIDANGWVHLKANMFCININCGRTPSNDLSDSGEVPFLKVYNIVNNKIDFEYKPQFIPKEVSDSALGKSKLLPNDVIMNIVGPPLKKIAIIPEDYPEWSMNQAIVRFRPLKYVLPKYLFYCLQFDETLREVINDTRGVVGQSNISVSQSRNLSMPIPSIDEQHEIVYILEQLIQKESTVLDILNAKKDELELLTQSILAKAFTGSLGTGDAAEEPAISLSISSN